ILSLLCAIALGATVNVLPGTSELAGWSAGWSLAAVLLLGASATLTQWWSHTAGGRAREVTGPHAMAGIAALGVGLFGAHALALRGIQFRPLGAAELPAGGLDALGLTVAAAMGALAVAIAVLSAWFDWRN